MAWTASKRRQKTAAYSHSTVDCFANFPVVSTKARIPRAHQALWRNYALGLFPLCMIYNTERQPLDKYSVDYTFNNFVKYMYTK